MHRVLSRAAKLSVRQAHSFALNAPKTRTTTLPNGLTVASEAHPAAQTSTVGVWIDAGSRAENEANNGTAHFLEHLSFKGTANRSQKKLELEIEQIGGHLNAYTSRENTVFYAKSLKKDVPKVVDILSDILQRSKLEPQAIENERSVIIRESEEVDKIYEEVLFDHLHSVAFQGQSLGRTILGPKENIETITQSDLQKYIGANYKADRMVLVGTGAVEHEELVELAKKHFGNLPASDVKVLPGTGSINPKEVTKFVGSEVRVRDDTIPTAHVAIAVEGVSWSSPDYYPALVAQAVIGSWDRVSSTANTQGSKLAQIVSRNNLASSFMSFSTSYHDTGLWGIYLVSDDEHTLDDLVHFTLKQWNRLSVDVSDAEVERAKSQLKASLLLSLDGTTASAEDIGRQLITTGIRQSPEEVEKVIDAVTTKDVKAFADKYLWDQDVAIAGLGKIQFLRDYMRIRNDMTMLRW
ncbi:mitochondrial processing peptidase [Starmerella bacillaris]|uniref:mitochondrial processing peptidase n=1 Tax=Starmerella bacillaris TaxID=1247836 RepID=A0AAV5RE39_STABA|nr:mitochondrial processing peptidase [Starmerella bacillaris]